MTGTKDYDKGMEILRSKYKIPLVFLTQGKAGASIITTRKGALKVMPQKEEILAFIDSRSTR